MEVHGAAILVEIKGFDLVASPVAYLSDAIGQCVGEEIGRRAIHQARVGVIAFDPLREEIIEWRHSSTP